MAAYREDITVCRDDAGSVTKIALRENRDWSVYVKVGGDLVWEAHFPTESAAVAYLEAEYAK